MPWKDFGVCKIYKSGEGPCLITERPVFRGCIFIYTHNGRSLWNDGISSTHVSDDERKLLCVEFVICLLKFGQVSR